MQEMCCKTTNKMQYNWNDVIDIVCMYYITSVVLHHIIITPLRCITSLDI